MEVDYDSTLGATYIGVTITACLYGISTLHGYTYWNQQTQDHTITRISMAVLWLADTAKLVCAAHIGYRLLITGYEDDPAAMFYSTWSINMELLLTALIIFVAQVFTAYHAWKSAKRINVLWATPRVIRIIGIIALAFGTTLSSLAWIYWDIREMEKHRWVASIWLGCAAFGSIVITYMLSALLVSTYVQARSTIGLINEFLRCIIHTGFLTSILTVANLLAFSFMGQYIQIAVNFPLGTLHLITLLTIMNARPQEISDGAIAEEYELSITEHKDRLHNNIFQTSLKGCLRNSQVALKVPSKIPTTDRSIKVFVQRETHIIGIPRIGVNYSRPMINYRDDLHGLN
ncbi:unnamed protein product [Rhizoctonia solani]|uniref:DUF6534 domain-containing protein n=1 Tax=Rhizoctonia solani TaxID=456999 RepID=A0A8H3BZB7_9AGAM|nr:unnamed protein product [Rhizoctonia solani]